MSKPGFVYVTYIKSSAEKVWRALTDGEITRQYWSRHHNDSDWKVGSAWKHRDFADASLVDVVGTVIENDYPRRLVVSWASPGDVGVSDKTSRVTFDIAQDGDTVRLTVTHDKLEPGSDMEKGISEGWPYVLSGLKSVLETGAPLAEWMVRKDGEWHAMLFANSGK